MLESPTYSASDVDELNIRADGTAKSTATINKERYVFTRVLLPERPSDDERCVSGRWPLPPPFLRRGQDDVYITSHFNVMCAHVTGYISVFQEI